MSGECKSQDSNESCDLHLQAWPRCVTADQRSQQQIDDLRGALSRIEGIDLVAPFVIAAWWVIAHAGRLGPLVHRGARQFTGTGGAWIALHELMPLNQFLEDGRPLFILCHC